ncbi:MAG: hypothetical protein ACR2FU_25515 [Streptosporangiaceae bacterium]
MRSGSGLHRWLAGGAIAAGLAGAVLAIAGITTPLRVPLVLIFLSAVPALAVASLLPGLDGLAKLVVAGTAAIVIDIGVAEVQLATGTWSPRMGLVAVALISVMLAACRPFIASQAATERVRN